MHRGLMDWRRLSFGSCVGLSIIACASSSLPRASAADDSQSNQPVDAATKKLMAANGLFQRSLFKLAGDQYEQFLKENPDHPEATAARYALAVCHYRLNELVPAIAQLRHVLSDPKFEQRDEALAVLGYCELSDKEYDAALKDFAELTEKYPKSKHAEQAALYRAQTLYLAGKTKDAAAACDAFLKQYPKSDQGATAVYFMALSQKANGQNAEAVQTLDLLNTDYPNSRYQLDATLLAGQALEAQGKFPEAAEQYQKMLAAAPETRKADALYSLGVALYKGGKFADSIPPLSSVVKDFSTSTYAKPAKLQLGLADLAAGKTADARAALSEVAKEDPARAAEAQYGLAQCDITDKKFDSAYTILDALSKLQPPPPNLSQVLLDRAVCLMESAKFEEAAKEFDALATQYPNGPQLAESLYRQAFCLHKLTHYDASHTVCEKFTKLVPGDFSGPVAELDAENLFLLTKYPDAEKAFDALASASKDEQKQLRFKVRAGQCAYFAANYPEAVQRLGPLAADPRVAASDELQTGIFLLGDAQLQQGKNAEAAAALKQFLSVTKADKREAQFKLGLAQIRSGDSAGAQATLTELSQAPSDSQWVQRGLFELGQLQYKAGQGDAARASLSKALAANPAPEVAAPASYLLGWVDFDAKKYPDAASTWGGMVEHYPAHALAVDAAFQQGVALKEAGKNDDALTALTKFAQAHPDNPNSIKARQLAASILASQGKGAESTAMLADLAKDPKASDAVIYELAWAQRGQKDMPGAMETYQRLLKDHADSKFAPAARTELAELLYADKNYDQAAPLLEAVASDASADPKIKASASYRLAWCYQKLNKPDKAAAIFTDFAGKYPDDPQAPAALLQAGIAQADAGTLDVAEKNLSTLLAKYPDHKDAPIAMLKLGEVQAGQNNFDASLKTNQDFLQKYPKDSFAYRAEFGIGWALENQRKYDDARAAYQKVIAASNGETAARAQFQTGETYLAEQKFEQAVPALLAVDDVYAYPKWSARALFEAGRAFEQLKQPEQATLQYTQLISKYKDAPEAGLAQDRLKTIKGS